MVDIYAACISVSQSIDAPRVSAHLLIKTEDRDTKLTIEWQLPHKINPAGNPSEWLYAVLSRLVQDFDNHTVTAAEISGVEQMKEDASA